jgi:hypothetical protein
MRRPRIAALSACALGAALVPTALATAQAPPPAPPTSVPPGAAVTFDHTCYAPGDAIRQTGHGFAPNAQVLQLLGLAPFGGGDILRTLSTTVTTDASGNFAIGLRAPQLARPADRREQGLSIFLDPGALSGPAPPDGPAVPWTLSGRDVKVAQWASRTADPARSMTVDAYGWTGGHANLYAHYYRGTTRIRSVKLGALTGVCGLLKKQVRQFPFRGVKAGEWRVFFSDTAVLDKATDHWVRRTVVVPRAKATA